MREQCLCSCGTCPPCEWPHPLTNVRNGRKQPKGNVCNGWKIDVEANSLDEINSPA
jgi:hypothetical protein